MYFYFPENYWWSLQVLNAIAMGGEMTEIDRICAPLRPLAARLNDDVAQDAWLDAWARDAERLERLAAEDEANGLRATAYRKYTRAANYFLVAENMVHGEHNRGPVFYQRGLDAFAKSLELSPHAAELVEVPYEGTTLPAIFVPAEGVDGPAPCMVHFDGRDDVKEFTYLRHGQGLADRGVSMLIVDHPGSGGGLRLRKLFAMPEIERAATASVDYLATRDDVDMDQLGIIAQSMGGYYAPRAAAFEKRFKLCAVWGAIWDYGALLEEKFGDATLDPHDHHLFGEKDPVKLRAYIERFSLEEVMDKVECSLLVIHGENDRQCPLWTAEKTYERAVNASERELRVFTLEEGGAEHCQVDVFSIATDYLHDRIGNFFAATPNTLVAPV